MASVIARTLKGGAGFFTAKLIKRALSFAFIVAASRALGPAEYGILALGLSVMGVGRRVAAFGLPTTIQRFLSGEGEQRSAGLYGAILLTGGVAAVVGSTGLILAAPAVARLFEEPSLVAPLRVLSLGIVLAIGLSVTRAVLQAQERVRNIVVVDTLQGATKVGALLLLLLLWAKSAVAAAWAVVGSFGFAFLVAAKHVQKISIRPIFSNLRSNLTKVVRYSAPLVVVGFGYFVAQQADRLMLGWLADASSVGLYTVAAKLAMVMGTLHAALVSIFKPIASQAYRNDMTRQMRRSYLFIGKWVGTANGLALLAFTGAGPWLLQIFGVEYANDSTYHVLILLSSLYFVGTWVGPTGALLQMSDGQRVELLNTVVFVVINIALNYMLISTFGVVGAAAATLLSGVVRNVMQVCELAFWHGVTPFATKNTIVLVMTIIGTSILVLMTAGLPRMIITLVLMLVLASYVLITSNDEEKKAIRRLVSRISMAIG